MSKFKVGDKVRVINNPNTNMHYYMDDRSDWQDFVFDMPSMAGKVVTISSVARHGYRIKEHQWHWTDEMFSGFATEPREFIVIRRDGSDVIASHKRGNEIVKTAKAKCAPGDEFNFDTGAKLAFDRLMGREEPKPRPAAPAPKFKVGDRVVVIGKYEGEISAVNKDAFDTEPYLVYCPAIGTHSGGLNNVFCKPEHRDKCTWRGERDLSPAPEPKYYTGKVVCIKNGTMLFRAMLPVGRIFEINDGRLVTPLFGINVRVDYIRNHTLNIKSVDDLNARFYGDIIFAEVTE